jgi:hypothetical protein
MIVQIHNVYIRASNSTNKSSCALDVLKQLLQTPRPHKVVGGVNLGHLRTAVGTTGLTRHDADNLPTGLFKGSEGPIA